MSSFFGKEEAEKNLQYDDIAFMHFLVSVCGVLLFIMAVAIIGDLSARKRVPYSKLKKSGIFDMQVENEKKRQGNYIFSASFCWKFLLLICLVSIVGFCSYVLSTQDTKMIGFDPHEILGVEYDAPVGKIKKAYRKLALEYHPDRNPNNPEVGAKFIMISKAYECLTNEKAKENCLKYGNPDGQTSFKVGIGLPSFVINSEHQLYVLPVVFGILLLVIPAIFIRWNNNLRAKDDHGLMVSNYPYLWNFFYPQFTLSNVICMFSCLRQLNDFSQILTDTKIKTLVAEIRKRNYIKEPDLQRTPPQCLPTLVQLLEHLEGKKLSWRITRQFEDLSTKLIHFSLPFCKREFHGKPLMDNPEWPITWLGTPVLRLMVQFPRRFYNALYGQPLSCSLELLNLTDQEIRILAQQPINNVQGEVIANDEAIDNFVKRFPSEERQKNIKRQLQNLPLLTVQIKATVDEQETNKMSTMDIANFQYTVKRKNNSLNFCALKNYPFLKQEEFYFIFTFNGNLIHFQAFKFPKGKNEYTGKFTYQQDFPKEVEFVGRVVSDVYYGLDTETPFKFEVVDTHAQQEVVIHEEDSNIEKLPKTTLESMFSLEVEGESDKEMSDGESDDEDLTVLNHRPRTEKQKVRNMEPESHQQRKPYYQEEHHDDHGHGHSGCC